MIDQKITRMSVPSYTSRPLSFDPYTQTRCYMCGTVGKPSDFVNAYFRDLDQEYLDYPEYVIESVCKDLDCNFPQNNISWAGKRGYQGYWSEEYRPLFGQPSDNVSLVYIPFNESQRQSIELPNRGLKSVN